MATDICRELTCPERRQLQFSLEDVFPVRTGIGTVFARPAFWKAPAQSGMLFSRTDVTFEFDHYTRRPEWDPIPRSNTRFYPPLRSRKFPLPAQKKLWSPCSVRQTAEVKSFETKSDPGRVLGFILQYNPLPYSRNTYLRHDETPDGSDAADLLSVIEDQVTDGQNMALTG